ncbi:terminase small subunit [Niallia circulans]|uniref:terminase small subunit n=1 Tax=Niallia circulans TaxID=1397 RepID=UPI003D9961A9
MARARDPNRDKAYNLWKEHNGEITNREIANQLDIDEKKVAVWKSRDKWGQDNKDNVVQQKKSKKKNVVQQKVKQPTTTEELTEDLSIDNFIDDSGLTFKQGLFCLYYVRSFNATQSAINAGYSPATAHVQGPRLLSNVRVREEIKRIKQSMANELFIEGVDVLNKIIKIAFSDITDFLTFGQREEPVIGAFGPLTDDNDNPITQEVNFVDFKHSNVVDGTLITEVKQGKDGVSIKLEDRKWALDKLLKYFETLPEHQKSKLQEEKIKAEIEKIRLETKIDDIDSSKTVIVTNEDEMRKVLEDESN